MMAVREVGLTAVLVLVIGGIAPAVAGDMLSSTTQAMATLMALYSIRHIIIFSLSHFLGSVGRSR